MSPSARLMQISPHVFWMPPAPPDRPSLCAVIGAAHTLILDAGASRAHTQAFLDALAMESLRPPRAVILSHWHWDHVFGAEVLAGCPLIAHEETARQLAIQAGYAWDDGALDQRVADGREIAFCADNIRLELPEPRQVRIVLPDIVFTDRLTFDLGNLTCVVQHVGGDHAADACVIHVVEDRVLFLSDCLYDNIYAPDRHYTAASVRRLISVLEQFPADVYVEGHVPAVMSRADYTAFSTELLLMADLVSEYGSEVERISAAFTERSGRPVDEDVAELVRAFVAGLSH